MKRRKALTRNLIFAKNSFILNISNILIVAFIVSFLIGCQSNERTATDPTPTPTIDVMDLYLPESPDQLWSQKCGVHDYEYIRISFPEYWRWCAEWARDLDLDDKYTPVAPFPEAPKLTETSNPTTLYTRACLVYNLNWLAAYAPSYLAYCADWTRDRQNDPTFVAPPNPVNPVMEALDRNARP